MKPLILACLVSVHTSQVLGSPEGSPSVHIQGGNIVGSLSGGIESFKGVPYAEPPTGPLRLKPARPVTTAFGTLTATSTHTACPQIKPNLDILSLPPEVLVLLATNPIAQAAVAGGSHGPSPQGEDCLTVNIQRPKGTTSSSALPVLFWIYGGGFEAGSTQGYDGSSIVNRSVELGQPVVFVEVNYRVNAFGFLPGKALQQEGGTNLGLRDQRLGLEWVQQNVAAFGGDPNKVTIWGESAGSFSVFNHLIIDGGDNRNLFRAAIMESGMAFPATDITSSKAEKVFEQFCDAAGCAMARDKLECLRQVDYETFLRAASSFSGQFSYRGIDLNWLPRPDPTDKFYSINAYEALSKREFAKVPIIAGNQQDEGTLFSLVQRNLTTQAQLVTYFKSIFVGATRRQVAAWLSKYPSDPGAGSPFHTGAQYQLYPQYKRLAAAIGDFAFTLTRRICLEKMVGGLPAVWSYLNTFSNLPVVGTAHGLDTTLLYENAGSPVAKDEVLRKFIAFTTRLDLNALNQASSIRWPRYGPNNARLLEIQDNATRIIKDDFRQSSSKALATYKDVFQL